LLVGFSSERNGTAVFKKVLPKFAKWLCRSEWECKKSCSKCVESNKSHNSEFRSSSKTVGPREASIHRRISTS
jgi:hypothetical protein